jgi:hypothetical protein
VRPNARENGQISPAAAVRAVRDDGTRPTPPPSLARTRENRKNARKIGSHPGNPGVYEKKFANRLCAVEASHMKLQGRFCYMAFEDLATIWSHLVVKPEIR